MLASFTVHNLALQLSEQAPSTFGAICVVETRARPAGHTDRQRPWQSTCAIGNRPKKAYCTSYLLLILHHVWHNTVQYRVYDFCQPWSQVMGLYENDPWSRQPTLLQAPIDHGSWRGIQKKKNDTVDAKAANVNAFCIWKSRNNHASPIK